MKRIHTLTLNPALDYHQFVRSPQLGVLNRAESTHLHASGKGINVAQALLAQNSPATAIVPLGGGFGKLIEDALKLALPDLRVVPVAGETRCNVKINDSQNASMTEFNAAGAALRPEELQTCVHAALHDLAAGDVLVLSGSVPPGVLQSIYADLIREAKSRNIMTVVDSSGEALKLGVAAGPNIIKPNRVELEYLLDRRLHSYADVISGIKQLLQQDLPYIVVSLGSDGAVFATGETICLVVPPVITPVTTTGCGDSIVASVLTGLQRSWSWDYTSQFATAASVGRALLGGSSFPSEAQIQEHLHRVQLIPEDSIPDQTLKETS